MIPLCRTARLACWLAVLAAPAAWAGSAKIDFRLNRAFKKGDHVPTFVVWVETQDGEYVATVRMGKTAKSQHDRKTKGKPASYFKQWDKAELDVVKADAVTQATPWPGKSVAINWDLTSDKGAPLPKGEYVLKVECSIKGDASKGFSQVTSLPFAIGGRKTKFSKAKTALLSGRRPTKRSTYVQKLSLRVSK